MDTLRRCLPLRGYRLSENQPEENDEREDNPGHFFGVHIVSVTLVREGNKTVVL